MKIAINGFGRIGRSVFRIAASRKDIDVVAINDISDPDSLTYLLRYDSVMGPYPETVTLDSGVLSAGRQRCQLLAQKDPTQLPWKDLGVDVVVESTGRFRTREECQMHIGAGAKKVVLTVPPKDDIDALLVLGVNDEILKPEHQIISNASCTTNCLAPIAKILDDTFGLIRGVMTTVHAYTNDQSLADWYHQDLVATFENPVSVEAINSAMQTAAEGPMKGILQYCTDPVVSSDIIGNPHSSIFDSRLTTTIGTHSAKILSWYDNEWGYSSRVVDLIDRLRD